MKFSVQTDNDIPTVKTVSIDTNVPGINYDFRVVEFCIFALSDDRTQAARLPYGKLAADIMYIAENKDADPGKFPAISEEDLVFSEMLEYSEHDIDDMKHFESVERIRFEREGQIFERISKGDMDAVLMSTLVATKVEKEAIVKVLRDMVPIADENEFWTRFDIPADREKYSSGVYSLLRDIESEAGAHMENPIVNFEEYEPSELSL